MKTRILGKDLTVSAVGLGCMGFTHAYGQPSDTQEAANAIAQAVDMGYTFFDTAECYIGQNPDGTTAWNEELVGNALHPYRDQVVIASKFGVQHDADGKLVMDSSPATIRSSIEGSLRRLRTDHIDLYYQHRLDPKTPVEEVATTMNSLMREGKITHWGISEADEDSIRRAHAVCPLTCVQNRYSMMARWHEKLFPVLEELNIGYVAFSPLANGVLTEGYKPNETFAAGDYRIRMPQYAPGAYEANRPLLTLVRGLADMKNATPSQIALAWMMAKKPYIVPIPGSRKVERIRENAGAAEVNLTPAEVAAMDERLDALELSGVFGGSPVKK